jgi:diacylglycerol kinase family enzyme
VAVDVEPITDRGVPARRRWLARLAFLAAVAAVLVLLVFAGLRSSLWLIAVAFAGTAVMLAGAWWFLTRRRVVRWLALGLAVAAPVTVFVLFAVAGLVWVVVLSNVLWAVAGAAGRAALAGKAEPGPAHAYETPPPRRPFLIMNPRAGGGKVQRFGLVGKAEQLGAEVAVLDAPGMVDVAALARDAVARGADLLGVAGGDGTQALVAGIAAEHGLPFLVISAGTRNHFALDLGLDREDPAKCLDALTDGVEVRVDLGLVGDRTFVNNASFGAYAAVVQSPAYRDDKTRTTLELLPDLLVGQGRSTMVVRAGDRVVDGPQAVLVSNNTYQSDDVGGMGRRLRLDRGVLGVLSIKVTRAADAAGLARGRRAKAFAAFTADEVVVEADGETLPVGVDGEALLLPVPVRCAVRPAALRVRVPRDRPGVPQPKVTLDWTRLRDLALPGGRRRREREPV